jgi:hypothetical protein
MKIAILTLTLVLAGCVQEEPSLLVGTWVSEITGAKIKISADDDCRYYFESNKGVGLECTLEHLSQRKARITFSQGGGFAEGEISKVVDEIMYKTPGGGLDFLDFES